jgi:hypothetical protein
VVSLEAVDARGARHTQRAERVGRGPWVLATLPPLDPPITVDVHADGFEARAVLTVDPPIPTAEAPAPSALALSVDGEVLSPEIPGDVLLYAGRDRAGQRASLAADDLTLTITPAQVTLDACGLAVFRATAMGLAAPVLVTIGSEARRVRLPLAPGAVIATVSSRGITLSHALGGLTAYVLEGDPRGPLRWRSVVLDAVNTGPATAALPLAPEASWALASASAEFDRVSGSWRTLPPGAQPCTDAPLGARWARVRAPIPAVSETLVAFDGALRALAEREAIRARTRRISLWCAAGSLSLLAAIIVRAVSLRRAGLEREGLSRGSGAQRIAALGVLSLAVMAAALALIVQLRA